MAAAAPFSGNAGIEKGEAAAIAPTRIGVSARALRKGRVMLKDWLSRPSAHVADEGELDAEADLLRT